MVGSRQNQPAARWNDEAAARAAAELRRAADALEQANRDRYRAAEDAAREWRGSHRRRFDDNVRDATLRATALAEEFRATARRIDEASQRFRDEQVRQRRAR